MVKLTAVSVSLVFLQLSVLSRTSVGVPVPTHMPSGMPVWHPITGSPDPPAQLDGQALNAAIGVSCVPFVVTTLHLGTKLVQHCVNRLRTKPEADPERGPVPESTASAHDPDKDIDHSKKPDERTPLLERPSADAAHSSKPKQ